MGERMMLYTKVCEDEQKKKYHLRYFLRIDSAECGTVYGAEIEKEEQGVTEREVQRGLSEQREEIEQFLFRLWEGTAFPVELAVLCDDFIAERENGRTVC